MINLQDAVKAVGHSCREKEYLRIAGELGLSAPWTQADVDAIRAARTFNPGVAAKKAKPTMRAAEFLAVAKKIGLAGPPHTMRQIHKVRDEITPAWEGMTSDDMAACLGVIDVEWVRRTARQHGIGKMAAPGCYMHNKKRIRRPSKSRYFSDDDIALLRNALPDSAFTRTVTVNEQVYQAARATGDPDVVLEGWLEDGASTVVPSTVVPG